MGITTFALLMRNKALLRAAGSGEPSSGCGFLDQALQRQAHRVVKIGGGEVGAAELQLGDEAHEKYAAPLIVLPWRVWRSLLQRN